MEDPRRTDEQMESSPVRREGKVWPAEAVKRVITMPELAVRQRSLGSIINSAVPPSHVAQLFSAL